MIRFHVSSTALSAEILAHEVTASISERFGISRNFREKTGFCFKSALFSLNASEKAKLASRFRIGSRSIGTLANQSR